MEIILPVHYFPRISWFIRLVDNKDAIIGSNSLFYKQSSVTRTILKGSEKNIPLNVPTLHPRYGKNVLEIEIADTNNWKSLHWKTIQSCYGKSPFFIYFEDEIRDMIFYEEKALYLFLSNIISGCAQLLKISAINFQPNAVPINLPETVIKNLNPYYQRFGAFEPDLSIIDLICNMGPHSLEYLHNPKYLYSSES
jgi:hypothetical protein